VQKCLAAAAAAVVVVVRLKNYKSSKNICETTCMKFQQNPSIGSRIVTHVETEGRRERF
jgi:hypothetical protein